MSSDFQTLDPTTEILKQSFPFFSPERQEQALQQGQSAFLVWRSWSIKQRAQILDAVALDLENNAGNYAALMAEEMGKPLTQGVAEIKKCALTCRYYATNSAQFLEKEVQKTEAKNSFVQKDPLGIILTIMPWNFPFWQFFRIAAPALMAGNVILLKHAANVPQCALAIECIFQNTQAPFQIVQSIFVSHGEIGKIISHQNIKAVSLTGSEKAGRAIAKQAGASLKSCVMELGGCDPFLVFDDADLDKAVFAAARSRLLNSGQGCVCAKRFLIHHKLINLFCENLIAAVQKFSMGNPIDPLTELGPLATKKQRDDLHAQVLDAKNKGAHVHCGGEIPGGAGFFYPATVITNVNPSMRIWHEETFGPVATVISFKTDAEALNIANATPYGLGASIWTHDTKRIEHFLQNLECGLIFINDFVRSDPRLPFGGVKNSGFGRELGKAGLLSFVNTKTIWES